VSFYVLTDVSGERSIVDLIGLSHTLLTLCHQTKRVVLQRFGRLVL